MFSSTKDDVRENWGIIRGGEDLLQHEAKTFFTSYRRGEFGIEVLTSNIKEVKKHLNSDVVIESASLEEIMVLMEKGVFHV